MNDKEKLDKLRESIDSVIEIVIAGEEGYINRALTILSDAKECTKDDNGSYMNHVEEEFNNWSKYDDLLLRKNKRWRGYKGVTPEMLLSRKDYLTNEQSTSTSARKIYLAVMNSTDPEITSLSHEEKMKLIDKSCAQLIRDEWEASGKGFDLQGTLEYMSIIKDIPCDSEVEVNIVDRSIIKKPTFNAITTEVGPDKKISNSWNPGMSLLDHYNELNEDGKYIVNICCSDISNKVARVIISMLIDPSSEIYESNSLFCLGALATLDITDDKLYNILSLCKFDFKSVRRIVDAMNKDLHISDHTFVLAKDKRVIDMTYLKYIKILEGGNHGEG